MREEKELSNGVLFQAFRPKTGPHGRPPSSAFLGPNQQPTAVDPELAWFDLRQKNRRTDERASLHYRGAGTTLNFLKKARALGSADAASLRTEAHVLKNWIAATRS